LKVTKSMMEKCYKLGFAKYLNWWLLNKMGWTQLFDVHIQTTYQSRLEFRIILWHIVAYISILSRYHTPWYISPWSWLFWLFYVKVLIIIWHFSFITQLLVNIMLGSLTGPSWKLPVLWGFWIIQNRQIFFKSELVGL